MQNYYYFSYNVSTETKKKSNCLHTIILKDNNLDTAKQRAENFIKNRELFTGSVENYNIILLQINKTINTKLSN